MSKKWITPLVLLACVLWLTGCDTMSRTSSTGPGHGTGSMASSGMGTGSMGSSDTYGTSGNFATGTSDSSGAYGTSSGSSSEMVKP